MIRIETERLVIRDHVMDDIEPLHNLLSDEESMYYLPDICTDSLEESKINLIESINESQKGPARIKYFFGIFDKAENYIGEIGYTVFCVDPDGYKNVHLGYFIHKLHWEKGYATEAVKAVIDYAFTRNKVRKIETGCLTDNTASEKIMIKCGFTEEARKIEHTFLNGKWRTRVEYGLLNNGKKI
jgi:ribosomal-protein-alanine N-acetyltransferase